MEKYPTVKVIWGRRYNKQTLDSPVEIEVYFARKRKWIATGIKSTSKNWNQDKWIIGRSDAVDANLAIENLLFKIQNYIRKLIINRESFNWSLFNTYLDSKENYESFIEFVEDSIKNKNDIRESTKINHRKLTTALREFGVINNFNDLTKANILKYDAWLHGRKNYTQSTIASYHKFLKIYINEALRKELINHNPYLGIKINRGKPAGRRFLTVEELEAIEHSMMPTASIERVRDMFVFQCYTGLAYSDMKKFNFNNVINKSGRYVLHDIRHKTGEDYYIVLLPKAVEILAKYNNNLPVITIEQYNLRLKLVASYAGISKNLTSHMGRHTYASLCLNSGVKIEVLAQMMGHTDIKTTQIYAKMVNATVEDAYLQLENNEKIKILIDYLNRIIELFVVVLKSDNNNNLII